MIVQTPFFPSYGITTPGANIPAGQFYYNTADAYNSYTFNAGTWHTFGVFGQYNATAFQGVAIDNTPPTSGQVITFNGTVWKPT